jgi:hypothetical protein
MLPEQFHETEKERVLPNLFYEVSVIMITKPDKDITKRKIKTNFLAENTCKNSQ